ncbi:MAG: ATP-binding protein [Spirochaetaceae bacterium]|jgi:predicted AAA+ superfamily ATPase|nr:ATP-binding protein [Spirochaetaceae bacterium]
MMPRIYEGLIDTMRPGRVYILYGARQVGKTTLLNTLLSRLPSGYRFRLESGDNVLVHERLSPGNFQDIFRFVEGLDLLVIDEAQRIPEIGRALKILTDHRPELSILISGSSAFELAGQVGEPLTGRKKDLPLYPLSLFELGRKQPVFELDRRLEDFLVYGMYPAVLCAGTAAEKQEILQELAGSYLLKDILELDRIKSSKVLLDLLRLLAWQIGSEVSHTELGQKLSLDKKTVARYVDLLEKAYVIYQVRGFSGNARNEISKKSKYYFFDTGIRNVLISAFNPPAQRNDLGHLWENFLMSERIKTRQYAGMASGFTNEPRFWRTWEQKEVDLIEQRGEALFAYEFKWKKGPDSIPEAFRRSYPQARCAVISRENWEEFLLGGDPLLVSHGNGGYTRDGGA